MSEGMIDQTRQRLKLTRLPINTNYESVRLKQIIRSEIPDELQGKLKEIAQKANPNGEFPKGSLTWGDYYDVVHTVGQFVPKKQRILYLDNFSEFMYQMIGDRGISINAQTPITDSQLESCRIGQYACMLRDQPNGYDILLTNEGSGEYSRIMTGVIFDKIQKTGLPIRQIPGNEKMY